MILETHNCENEYRCYKCGAESTKEWNFKYNGEIIGTQHFCDECFMNLLSELVRIENYFEIEEDTQ